MQEELVSVIIPSFNHSQYINQTINSVINQTYKNIELLIIDDNSTDDSNNIISENANICHKRFVRYEHYIKDRNLGLIDSLNFGIKWAKGKYISFLASDDIFLPEKINIQIDYMDANTEFGMCFGKCEYIDENNKTIQNIKKRKYKGGYIFEDIILMKFHPPVNYMIRKDILISIGGYPEGILTEDFYMNCRISEKYEIGFIDTIISKYRMFTDVTFKYDQLKLYDAQRKVIEYFKHHNIYWKACREENIRRFTTITSCIEYKSICLKLLPMVITKFYDLKVLKGIIKLIIIWKKCSFYYKY